MKFAFSLHRFLLRVALSTAHIFAWIILYQQELIHSDTPAHALVETTLIFALSQIVVVLSSPLAGRLFAEGMVRSMIIALISLAGSFALLGAYVSGLVDPWCIVGFGILTGAYRAFYSTPLALMRTDLTISASLVETIIGCIPFVAGMWLAQGNLSLVLFTAAGVAIAAIMPLLRFEAYERFEWTYRETFGMLLEPIHRRFVLQGIVRGIEGAALFVLWPLFLFIYLMPDFAVLGAVFTASILILLALRNLSHRGHAVRQPVLASAIVGGAWVARMTPAGPLAAVIAQAVGGIPQTAIPSVHETHDVVADGGSFLDEITTLKEISLGIGRLLLVLIFVAVITLHGVDAAFAAAFLLAAFCAASAEYLGNLREETL